MRPTRLRDGRTRAIAGALLIAVPPAAAAAEAAAPVPTPGGGVSIATQLRSLRAGERMDVHATATSDMVGRVARLEQQSASGPWRSLARSTVGAAGQILLHAQVQRSGLLRVSVGSAAERAVPVGGAGASSSVSSVPMFVSVGARLDLGAGRLSVLAGRMAWVRGRVMPAAAGRRVVLEASSGSGWQQLARANSDGLGRYRLNVLTRRSGVSRLRVRFSGDRQNASAVRHLRPLEVFRSASVSTFGGNDGLDGSPLACGGTLGSSTLGVADRRLPCGTRLTLRYGGHEVRVPVVDRGPYVGAREYDLTSATATRLGFSGTGEIWTTG